MMSLLAKYFAWMLPSRVELHASEICPECGSQLAREANAALASAAWLCPNPDCPPQVMKRLELWVSPAAMDIPGCDTALVAQLVQRGLVYDAAEFYRLKLKELEAVPGLEKPAAQKLFETIAASKKREAWRVLFGLGIPNIGVREAQTLCQYFATLDSLFATERERLLKLAGVTEVMARSLTHWQSDPVNRKLVRQLENAGVNFKT